MFNVTLVNPEIPPNTGNIGRLTLGTGSNLYIVGTPSFDLENDRMLKRAGLDYWEDVELTHCVEWDRYKHQTEGNYHLVTKFADQAYHEADFSPGDNLIFGGENRGVPPEIAEDQQVDPICIPMNDKVRSFNVCNAVAVVLFEALRQVPDGPSATPFSQSDFTCTDEYTADEPE